MCLVALVLTAPMVVPISVWIDAAAKRNVSVGPSLAPQTILCMYIGIRFDVEKQFGDISANKHNDDDDDDDDDSDDSDYDNNDNCDFDADDNNDDDFEDNGKFMFCPVYIVFGSLVFLSSFCFLLCSSNSCAYVCNRKYQAFWLFSLIIK